MGINVQVCWEKFANYWDVEMRLVPMEGDRFTLSARGGGRSSATRTRSASSRSSGSTFDGAYEPVEEICAALDDLQERTGLDVPVHVDGASGAFVAPFIDPRPAVGLPAAAGGVDQRLRPQVRPRLSRASAGSCGATPTALPEDLIFWVNYLGDNMPTFALNFSRPGAQVVAQYYNFLRLGFDGLPARCRRYARDVATRLSASIAELGPFELLTRGDELPVFAFKVKDEIDNFTAFDVSNALRERGWQVPAYTFPANRTDLAALRVVVRRGLHPRPRRPADRRPQAPLPRLEKQPEPVHGAARAGLPPLGVRPASRASPARAAGAYVAPPRRRGGVGTTARARSSPASATGWPTAACWSGRRARTASGRRRSLGTLDRRPLHHRLGRASRSARCRLRDPRRCARRRGDVLRRLDLLHLGGLPAVRRVHQHGAEHRARRRLARRGFFALEAAGSTGGRPRSSSPARCSSTSRRSRALDAAPAAEAGGPRRLDAGRPRLDLLPRRQRARLRRGRPRLDLVAARSRHGLADRRAQHARLDLLRHLGDRRLGAARDGRPARRGARHRRGRSGARSASWSARSCCSSRIPSPTPADARSATDASAIRALRH